MPERIKRFRKAADAALARHAAAKAGHKRAIHSVAQAEAEYSHADEARQIIQAIAETVQEEAHKRIAGVVSQCLATVFAQPYEFHIRFRQARGRTEAELVFVRDGKDINPIDASGGGVVDVAAFALRLSSLMLSRPARRRVMILDEPFRFVSQNYRANVRAMMEELSRDLGVQFIMVTHIAELQCGTVIDLTWDAKSQTHRFMPSKT